MVGWKRPAECRICAYPVADGGVRMVQLDAEKVSEWWKQKLNAEFEYLGFEDQWICQFCLWEARLEHESSKILSDQRECNWWAGHDTDRNYFQHFYLSELIHPCKVVLHQLPLSVNVNANSSSNSDNGLNANSNIQSNPQDAKFECDPTKRRCRKMFPTVEDKQVHISKFHVGKKYKFSKKARCIYCDKMVFTNKMKAHVQKSHENKPFIRCSYNNYQCNTYFQSLEEKKEHEEEFHNAVGKGKETDKLKCIYCDLADVKRCLLKKHMQSHHKSIAIRCNFHKLCSTYFHTEAERDEHVQNVHRRTCWQLPDGVECVYCKKICRDKKQLLDHVSSVHFLVRIKCGAHRCTQFFLSQSDCDQHFEEKHREEEDKKMFHCHDCGYRALRKINLTRHVSQKHLNSEFECPLCARVLHSKCAVNKHLRKVHVKSQQCRYCNTEVKFLKQHQKQLQCKVCNEMLPCLTSAARHGEICKE